MTMRTDQDIVDRTEALAAALNDWRWGGRLESGTYRDSCSLKAQACWQMAAMAQEILTGTDPENAVANLAEDPAQPANAENTGYAYGAHS